MTDHPIAVAPMMRTRRNETIEPAGTLREMMDSLPQLVFQADSQGALLYANRAWFDYTGLAPDQLANTSMHDLVYAGDRETYRKRWRESSRHGGVFEAEARLLGGDGTFRWHVVRSAPASEVGGESIVCYGVATDIDDLRRVQRTLRHSEGRLRLAQRLAGLGSWEWDIELGTMTSSPELAQLYGLDADRLAGDRDEFLARVHADDRERMSESLDDLLANGSQAIEHRIVRADGEVRWLAARAEVFADSDGRPVRAIGVELDITEQKRAEEALRAVDQRHKVLADAGGALTAATDAEGVAQAAVRCVVPDFADACTIELLDDGELKGAATLANSETLAEVAAAGSDEARRALESPSLLTIDDDSPSGITVLRTRVTHLGRRLGVMTVCRLETGPPFDVQDRLTIRELASRMGTRLNEQRVSSTKDEVLALVSHELRTPLTTLKGNANSLRRHGDRIDETARAEALRDIEADADRLDQIVRNMLALAQTDRGTLDSGLEPLILSRVVEAEVREHRERQPAPPVAVRVDGDRAIVLAHEAHLRQVVANLLSNAAKYGNDSAIDVVLSSSDEGAVLEVSDRGPGLPPAALRRVFEPFYRSAANARTAAGVGLGLTVCRRLIMAQGGSIHVEARPGGGTSFFVSLPRLRDEPPSDS